MMDAVPLLFAENFARLLDGNSLCSLKAFSSGHFGSVGRSLWENRLRIHLSVVFNKKAGNFDYRLTCTRNDSHSVELYTFDPADRRFVLEFQVYLLKSKYVDDKVPWTTAAPSDPTLLWWLRAPFARTSLYLYTARRQFLNLLPDYCTFNEITEDNNSYSNVFDEIIERSQACGRLEKLNCTKFFKKRGKRASTDWILTNKRLRNISYWSVDYQLNSPATIGTALDAIGVRAQNCLGARRTRRPENQVTFYL